MLAISFNQPAVKEFYFLYVWQKMLMRALNMQPLHHQTQLSNTVKQSKLNKVRKCHQFVFISQTLTKKWRACNYN